MKTKLVYTVVSGEEDLYLPQAMIAIYSARRYNPNAEILLVVDQDTNRVINERLVRLRDYLNQIIVVQVPSDMSKMLRSRFLKTALRQNIEGDFLYIDTDTVTCENLISADEIKADVAAVLDRHAPLSVHPSADAIANDISKVGLSISDLHDKYFNGGLLYVKDSAIAHRLYEAWHHNWDITKNATNGIDQPSLALANKQCGYPIEELAGTWNCQLRNNFINYLDKAKILHYFASNKTSPYSLYDCNIYEEVMQVGDVPENLKEALETPKMLFVPKHLLCFGKDILFCRTNIHEIFEYHPWLFNVFEYFAKLIVKKKI